VNKHLTNLAAFTLSSQFVDRETVIGERNHLEPAHNVPEDFKLAIKALGIPSDSSKYHAIYWPNMYFFPVETENGAIDLQVGKWYEILPGILCARSEEDPLQEIKPSQFQTRDNQRRGEKTRENFLNALLERVDNEVLKDDRGRSKNFYNEFLGGKFIRRSVYYSRRGVEFYNLPAGFLVKGRERPGPRDLTHRPLETRKFHNFADLISEEDRNEIEFRYGPIPKLFLNAFVFSYEQLDLDAPKAYPFIGPFFDLKGEGSRQGAEQVLSARKNTLKARLYGMWESPRLTGVKRPTNNVWDYLEKGPARKADYESPENQTAGTSQGNWDGQKNVTTTITTNTTTEKYVPPPMRAQPQSFQTAAAMNSPPMRAQPQSFQPAATMNSPPMRAQPQSFQPAATMNSQSRFRGGNRRPFGQNHNVQQPPHQGQLARRQPQQKQQSSIIATPLPDNLTNYQSGPMSLTVPHGVPFTAQIRVQAPGTAAAMMYHQSPPVRTPQGHMVTPPANIAAMYNANGNVNQGMINGPSPFRGAIREGVNRPALPPARNIRGGY